MTTRIDKTICKVSGSKNYLDDLSVVTGNLFSIDKQFYLQQLENIAKMNNVIIDNLNKHEELKKVATTLKTEFENLNIKQAYIPKKKGGEKLVIRPQDIINHKWFKELKSIESSSANVISQFELERTEISDKTKKIMKDLEIVDTFKLCGALKIENLEAISTTRFVNSFANKIIEILLSPMYNMKNFISKHWLSQIDNAVCNEAKDNTLSREDIQDYVYSFMIAKYRLSLTNSSKEFTKVMLDSLNQESIVNMNPARFANFIDGLKIDEIEGSDKVKKLALNVKEKISNLSRNKNISPCDILSEIQDLLDTDEEAATLEKEEVVEKPKEELPKDSVFEE